MYAECACEELLNIGLDSSSNTKVMMYYFEIVIRKIEICTQKDKGKHSFLRMISAI